MSDLPRIINSKGPGTGRSPRCRARRVLATRTGPDEVAPTSTTARMRSRRVLVRSPLMAKAKRRKILARRSKANHGRRPNAGRG